MNPYKLLLVFSTWAHHNPQGAYLTAVHSQVLDFPDPDTRAEAFKRLNRQYPSNPADIGVQLRMTAYETCS